MPGTAAAGAVAGTVTSQSTPWWTDLALWVAVWLPFAAIASRWVGSGWFPVQDQAVLDLRLRDLTSLDAPLVGAFSRFGWSHPGPVWFVVLAPFRWLAGSTGVLVGSILLYGAGFATFAVVVRRRYGTAALALALLALVPPVAAAGSFALLIPWNPHLAFAWYPTFLVLCVSATGRRPTDLGPAALLGVLLVQLHVGYLPIVAAPLAAAAALVAGRRGTTGLVDAVRRARGWAIATVVVCAPLVVEQVVHGREGNLGRLGWFFLNPPEGLGEPTGLRFGLGGLGGVLRLPLTGLGGPGEATEPFTGYVIPEAAWTILPLVVLLAGVAAVAHRRGDHEVLDAVVVAGAGLAAGVIALSRLVGERYAYLFTWRFALVWFVIGVAMAGLARLTSNRRGPRRPAVAPAHRRRRWPVACAVLSIAAMGGVVLATSITIEPDHVLPLERTTEELAAAVASGDRPSGPVQLVRFDGVLEGVADGVLNELDQQGWPVGVPPDQGFKYGDHRVVDEADASEIWFVTETSLGSTLATAVPGSEVRASATPLSDDEEAELVELQLALVDRLRDAGRLDLLSAVDVDLVGFALDGQVDTDGIEIDRLGELNAAVARSGTCRCAVVVVPDATPVDPAALVAGLPAPLVGPGPRPLLSGAVDPIVADDAPDPFVALDGDQVVLLATGPHVGAHRLQARVGRDLSTLGPPSEALARTPTWSTDDRRRFWAPTAIDAGERWLLAFSGPDATSGRQCIGAAFAATAAGPYEPLDEPVVCPRSQGGAIDPELVVVPGGVHLLWKVDGNCCGLPTELWSQPLDPATAALSGHPTRLLGTDDVAIATGEEPTLVEAPTMVTVDDDLVLLWSTGAWEGAGYAMGAARCASVSGPCRVVGSAVPPPAPDRAGAGGGAVVVDADGQPWLIYHAWDACCVGYAASGRRSVHVARLVLDDDGVRAVEPADGAPS